jgi:hypothetical protein
MSDKVRASKCIGNGLLLCQQLCEATEHFAKNVKCTVNRLLHHRSHQSLINPYYQPI